MNSNEFFNNIHAIGQTISLDIVKHHKLFMLPKCNHLATKNNRLVYVIRADKENSRHLIMLFDSYTIYIATNIAHKQRICGNQIHN